MSKSELLHKGNLFGKSSVRCLLYFSQVIGSISGVRYILETFPEIGFGPRLNVDIHRGALTEGVLTFAIVIISLGLSRKIPGSFFMKTWISSVSKLALQILGSDLTGGCMNPASVSVVNIISTWWIIHLRYVFHCQKFWNRDELVCMGF